jgi:signal peptidase I
MKFIKHYYQYGTFLIILILYLLFRILDVTQFTEATNYFSFPLFFIFLIIFFISLLIQPIQKKTIIQMNDWILFLSVSISFILLVFSFFIIPSNVNQQSMMPTLNDGDRIMITHFMYTPNRGDIIVIEVNKHEYPMIPSSTFITGDHVYFVKRLIGLPGDTISFEIENGQRLLFINNQKVVSVSGHAYIVTEQQQLFLETQIQNGSLSAYFVLGDNSQASLDSIEFGQVQEKDIMGKVLFKLWPFGVIYE